MPIQYGPFRQSTAQAGGLGFDNIVKANQFKQIVESSGRTPMEVGKQLEKQGYYIEGTKEAQRAVAEDHINFEKKQNEKTFQDGSLIPKFNTKKNIRKIKESMERTIMGESTLKDTGTIAMQGAQLAGKTAVNLGVGAVNTVKDIFDMVTSPKKTAQGIASIIRGIEDKSRGRETNDTLIIDQLLEQAKDSFDSPEQALETLTENPFDFVTMVSPKAGVNIAKKTADIGKNVLKTGGKIVDSGGKQVVSSLSGVPKEALNRAVKLAGNDGFVNAMRGNISPMGIVDEFKKGFNSIKNKKSLVYGEKRDNLKSKKGMTKKDLSLLKREFVNYLGEKGVYIKKSGDKYNISLGEKARLRKDTPGFDTFKNTINDIMSTTDNTVDYLDALKQRVSQGARGESGLLDKFHYDFANKIGSKISNKHKGYGEITSKYKELIDIEKELIKSFSLGKNNIPQQIYNKITKMYKNNKEITQDLFELVDSVTDNRIGDKMLGLEFSSLKPKSILGNIFEAGLLFQMVDGGFNRKLLALSGVASPRVIGEILAYIGYAKNKIQPFVEQMKKVKTAVEKNSINIPEGTQGNILRAGVVEQDTD